MNRRHPHHSQKPITTFSSILTQTFSAAAMKKGFCLYCRRYPEQSQRQVYGKIPPVLMINALPEKNHESNAALWATPGFLPESIGMFLQPDGQVHCLEGNLDQSMLHHSLYIHDLVGFVAKIHSTQDQKAHLVSLINGLATRPSLSLYPILFSLSISFQIKTPSQFRLWLR